jgi:hypothetical protein
LEHAIFVLKPQSPYAIRVVNREQKIDRCQCSSVVFGASCSCCLTALGMIAQNYAAGPTIWFGICYGTVEDGCLATRRFMELRARDEGQIGLKWKMISLCQPFAVVLEGRTAPIALGFKAQGPDSPSGLA